MGAGVDVTSALCVEFLNVGVEWNILLAKTHFMSSNRGFIKGSIWSPHHGMDPIDWVQRPLFAS